VVVRKVEGSTDKLNAGFNYHFEDVIARKIKIIEFIQMKSRLACGGTTILNSPKTKRMDGYKNRF